MNVYISKELPIPDSDVAAISFMLRESGVLCGAINPTADWYNWGWYAAGQELEGLTFTLLLDRNVYSLATQLADGKDREYTHSHRLAAAVLCFARCCVQHTDSAIAALEHELDSGESRLAEEHPMFLHVMQSDPKCLADFALGRCSPITLRPLPRKPAANTPTFSEADRPFYWWLNYGCALKLASLILDRGFTRDIDRILAFLRWCCDDFLFSAGATVYGSLALSPRRKARMFKKLGGTNVAKAIRGIRNAAWDMSLISRWELEQGKMSTTRDYYLICSFDEAVMDVAAEIMSQEQDADRRREHLRNRFILNWGEADGDRLMKAYDGLGREVREDPNRPAKHRLPMSHWKARAKELEETVRNNVSRNCDS